MRTVGRVIVPGIISHCKTSDLVILINLKRFTKLCYYLFISNENRPALI